MNIMGSRIFGVCYANEEPGGSIVCHEQHQESEVAPGHSALAAVGWFPSWPLACSWGSAPPHMTVLRMRPLPCLAHGH